MDFLGTLVILLCWGGQQKGAIAHSPWDKGDLCLLHKTGPQRVKSWPFYGNVQQVNTLSFTLMLDWRGKNNSPLGFVMLKEVSVSVSWSTFTCMSPKNLRLDFILQWCAMLIKLTSKTKQESSVRTWTFSQLQDWFL